MHLPGTLKYRYQLLQPSCDFGSVHVAVLCGTRSQLFPRDGWHRCSRYAPAIFPVWIQCRGEIGLCEKHHEGFGGLREISVNSQHSNYLTWAALSVHSLGTGLPLGVTLAARFSSAGPTDLVLACSVNPLDLLAATREARALALLPEHQPTGRQVEVGTSSVSGNVSSLSVYKDLTWGEV